MNDVCHASGSVRPASVSTAACALAVEAVAAEKAFAASWLWTKQVRGKKVGVSQ